MRHSSCWKLVRDGIGVELERRGYQVLRVDGELLERALLDKIVEEAEELRISPGLEEAGDLLEALVSWLNLKGYTLADALEAAARKREARGGFASGYLARVCGEHY